VSDATLSGLREFSRDGGHVLAVSGTAGKNESLTCDIYNRPRSLPDGLAITPITHSDMTDRSLSRQLLTTMNTQGLAQPVHVLSGKGDPAWGVEYTAVPYEGRWLLPLTNMLTGEQTVSLPNAGNARDLITGRQLDAAKINLLPMQPLLLEVELPSPSGP
jgi:hypothetical protein